MNSHCLQEDIGGNPKRAAVLTEFTDYVLGCNALNREKSQPFLTTDDLTHVWANQKTKRGVHVKPTEKKKDKQSKFDSKKAAADVCRLQNAKACSSQADKECKTAWGRCLSTLATSSWQVESSA